jgi:tetratricopeptide (TPR) repeat protein
VEELCSEEAANYIRQSRRRVKNNELLAALEFIDKAIEAEPENAYWYRERAKLHLKLKEYEKARKDYLQEAKLDSFKAGYSFMNVSLTYFNSGDAPNAVVWMKKAVQTDSTLISGLIDLAEMYEQTYHVDLALLTLNEYLKLVPSDHYAIYYRASLMPMPDVALEEVKRAIDLCRQESERVPAQYNNLLVSLSQTAWR